MKYIRVDIDDRRSIELCRLAGKKKYMTQAPAQRTKSLISRVFPTYNVLKEKDGKEEIVKKTN